MLQHSMINALRILPAVAAMTVGLAAPAAAGDSDYLQALQPRYVYLSASQLLSAGSKVCAATRSGRPGSDIVDMLYKDMGVSVSVAYEIVNAAVVHLGC